MKLKIHLLFFILFSAFAANVSGQNSCFTDEEAKKLIESIDAPARISDSGQIRKELLEMREEREKLNSKIAGDFEKNRALVVEANRMGERHFLRVCRMLKENGWLSKDALKDKGLDALTFLISNNKAFQLQREMLPVLVAASKKGYVEKPLLASLVDTINVGSGLPQVFGTEATIKNNAVYIYPLLSEEKVDEWRKAYNLPPLAVQIRSLEEHYFMPVVKMQRRSIPPGLTEKQKRKSLDTSVLGISNDDDEVLQIDTKLVNLNVRILTQDLKLPGNLNLSKEDFTILEDDKEQEISFFSTTDKPFDLVLLLDFSSSTEGKRGIIMKAAQRFVESARPTDRIAVVAFATEIKIVSELTTDKETLYKKIKSIKVEGVSPIWDALRFTYENIVKKEREGRRSAIIFMTDGLDTSEESTFADAMETVRHGDTTIFPIFLSVRPFNEWSKLNIPKANQSLSMLAEESGGQLYKANEAEDLNGIYEQVISDLGKVYSIGYEPKNEIGDGGWRALSVKIKTQPNLVTRTKRGYYAK